MASIVNITDLATVDSSMLSELGNMYVPAQRQSNNSMYRWPLANATTSRPGLMSGADKRKLDGLPSGGTAERSDAIAGSDNTKVMTPQSVKWAIDALQAEKATTSDVDAGTDDTKYMTVLMTNRALSANKATTTEAQGSTNDSHFMTPSKTRSHISAMLATEQEAKQSSISDKLMTPQRTKQALDSWKATEAQSRAGSSNVYLATPLGVAQYVDEHLASQSQAETGTASGVLMTPQRTTQAIGAKVASQAEAEAGTNESKLMTPLRTKQAIDALVEIPDVVQDRLQCRAKVKAASSISANSIICGTSSGYKPLVGGATFDLAYPILYAKSAISSGGTSDDNYLAFGNVMISSSNTVSYRPVYVVGTLSGNTFTVASSRYLTSSQPTSNDGYTYIPIGITSTSASSLQFISSRDAMAYRNGRFGLLSEVGPRVDGTTIRYNSNGELTLA